MTSAEVIKVQKHDKTGFDLSFSRACTFDYKFCFTKVRCPHSLFKMDIVVFQIRFHQRAKNKKMDFK